MVCSRKPPGNTSGMDGFKTFDLQVLGANAHHSFQLDFGRSIIMDSIGYLVG